MRFVCVSCDLRVVLGRISLLPSWARRRGQRRGRHRRRQRRWDWQQTVCRALACPLLAKRGAPTPRASAAQSDARRTARRQARWSRRAFSTTLGWRWQRNQQPAPHVAKSRRVAAAAAAGSGGDAKRAANKCRCRLERDAPAVESARGCAHCKLTFRRATTEWHSIHRALAIERRCTPPHRRPTCFGLWCAVGVRAHALSVDSNRTNRLKLF